jgi:hypothetical protein
MLATPPWADAAGAATSQASAAHPSETCFLHASNAINAGKVDSFDVARGAGDVYFRRDADFQEFFSIDAETQGWFRLLDQALASRGIDLVFIPLPTRGIVQSALLDPDDPDQAIFDPDFARGEFDDYLSALKAAGVRAVDIIAGLEDSGSWDSFFYRHDHHWTTTGSREVAEWAANVTKALPGYDRLSKYTFEVKPTGPTAYKSMMAMDIQQRCHITVEAEPETQYEVVAPEAVSADDLFGDTAQSNPAALVGTSFSAQSFFYFQAFLQQQTSLQVANYAVDGGQFDASLASLVFSRGFLDAPPPVIFWESPSYYDINFEARADFPQIVPAIFGQCSGDEIVKSTAEPLTEGKGATLTLAPDQKVAGPRYYVALDTDPSDNGKVTLDLNYSSGDHFVQRLGDFANVSNDGRYYFLLSDEPTGVLSSLTARTSSNPQHFNASICKVPADFPKEGT